MPAAGGDRHQGQLLCRRLRGSPQPLLRETWNPHRDRAERARRPLDGRYVRQVCEARDQGRLRYARSLQRPGEVEEATPLLRRTLASQPDQSVTMIQVGFSPPTLAPSARFSPPTGTLRSREKTWRPGRSGCSPWWPAASVNPGPKDGREYNIYKDLPSARKLFGRLAHARRRERVRDRNGPSATPESACGGGATVPGSTPSARRTGCMSPNLPDRPTWDLTSVPLRGAPRP